MNDNPNPSKAEKKDEKEPTSPEPTGSEAGGDDGEGRTGTKLGSTDS